MKYLQVELCEKWCHELQWALASVVLSWAFLWWWCTPDVHSLFPGSQHVRRCWEQAQGGDHEASLKMAVATPVLKVKLGLFSGQGTQVNLCSRWQAAIWIIYVVIQPQGTGALRFSEDTPYVWANTAAKSTENRLGNMLVFHRKKKLLALYFCKVKINYCQIFQACFIAVKIRRVAKS